MSKSKYNEAWTRLLAARQSGDVEQVHHRARELSHEARMLVLEQRDELRLAPCSHFMVVNGHCINCHEAINAVGN